MRERIEALATLMSLPLFGLPVGLIRALFGDPPDNDRGAPLDPQLHLLLSLERLIDQPELHERGVKGARKYFKEVSKIFEIDPPDVANVEDRFIEGPGESIPLRVYQPTEDQELPGCVFYHGGGFVLGDLEMYDSLCKILANRSRCHVISVDYRLAPEHPFPAAIEDGITAYRWVRNNAGMLNIDPDRISVAGDSAGGNIATVVSQRQIAEERETPDHQLLIYPKTDYVGDYPSREHFAEGFYLTWPIVEWFTDQYLSETDVDPATDPRVSPLQFDRLEEMPPTMMVTAGFDPLRDEGEVYADRLEEQGVPVVRRCFDRMIHDFVTLGGVIHGAARATADVAELYREHLERL